MAAVEAILEKARELLAQWTVETAEPEPERLDVVVSGADLTAAAEALIDAEWGYLAAITGLDLGPEAETIEVLYHFCSGSVVVTLRVRTPRDTPVVPTVCDVIPSASFFERELIEMLGVTVEGTPDPRRLFLPESWPEGVYPLRKDFEPRTNDAQQ
jgi:Ni,Fe-hydrogenase III component G